MLGSEEVRTLIAQESVWAFVQVQTLLYNLFRNFTVQYNRVSRTPSQPEAWLLSKAQPQVYNYWVTGRLYLYRVYRKWLLAGCLCGDGKSRSTLHKYC